MEPSLILDKEQGFLKIGYPLRLRGCPRRSGSVFVHNLLLFTDTCITCADEEPISILCNPGKCTFQRELLLSLSKCQSRRILPLARYYLMSICRRKSVFAICQAEVPQSATLKQPPGTPLKHVRLVGFPTKTASTFIQWCYSPSAPTTS